MSRRGRWWSGRAWVWWWCGSSWISSAVVGGLPGAGGRAGGGAVGVRVVGHPQVLDGAASDPHPAAGALTPGAVGAVGAAVAVAGAVAVQAGTGGALPAHQGV